MRRIVLSLIVLWSSLAWAQGEEATGIAIRVRGNAYVSPKGSSEEKQITKGMSLFAPYVVRTEEDAAVHIRMLDGSVFNVGSKARVTVNDFIINKEKKNREGNVKLAVGRIWIRLRSWFGSKTTFEVKSDNAVAGVRGTEFIMKYDKDSGVSSVVVVDGTVAMKDIAGKLEKMLGPKTKGLFDGKGKIVVRESTPSDLDEAKADTMVKARIEKKEIKKLKAMKLNTGTMKKKAIRPPIFGSPDALPPGSLPLEPGVGTAKTKIRVEVRQ